MSTPVLDRGTRRALAQFVVGIDGPYERRGWQVEQLFRDADWPGDPVYDGAPREAWVADRLNERADDREATERLLLRICDPRTYDDPRVGAEMREALNRLLQADGIAVAVGHGRLEIIQVTPSWEEEVVGKPRELTLDLADIVPAGPILEVLRSRLDEAAICREHGAHFAAIVTLGSLLEGVLDAVLGLRPQQGASTRSAPSNGGAASRREREPTLADLLRTAHEQGLIQSDAKDFGATLREYRNFVHPRAQLRRDLLPDEDTTLVCWNIAVMTLNDLGKTCRLPGRVPQARRGG